MIPAHGVFPGEIGDRARDFANAVDAARAEPLKTVRPYVALTAVFAIVFMGMPMVDLVAASNGSSAAQISPLSKHEISLALTVPPDVARCRLSETPELPG